MPFTDGFLRWLRGFAEPAQDRLVPKRFQPNNFRASSTGNDRTGTPRCGNHTRKATPDMTINTGSIEQYRNYFVDTPQGKKFNLDGYVTLDEAKSIARSHGIQYDVRLDGDVLKVTLTEPSAGIDAVGSAETVREAWALALGKAFEQATTPAPVEDAVREAQSSVDGRLEEAREFLAGQYVDLDNIADIANAAELAVACLTVLIAEARKQF